MGALPFGGITSHQEDRQVRIILATLDDEALDPIGSLDDLGLDVGQDAGHDTVKDRPLIGAVGEQFPEKGKQTEQYRQ